MSGFGHRSKRKVYRAFVYSIALLSFGSGACAEIKDPKAPTIARDGPEMCFDAIRTALAPETRVATIYARYAPAGSIFRYPDVPPNELIKCEVAYQDPDSPDKLLALKMDPERRIFYDPVEASYSFPPGSPDSSIERFLIPLGQVNTSKLASLMKERELQFDETKGTYSWITLHLKEPRLFNDTHVLRIELKTRIGSDEFPEVGAMEISIDGKEVLWEQFPNGLLK